MDKLKSIILVVDDDVLVLSSVAATLRKFGFDVQMAQSGQEGLEFFTQHRREILLILADIVMPGMLGTEIARKILRSDPQAKLILMSGYPQAGRTLLPLIEKPFLSETLLSGIESIVGPVAALTGARAALKPVA